MKRSPTAAQTVHVLRPLMILTSIALLSGPSFPTFVIGNPENEGGPA